MSFSIDHTDKTREEIKALFDGWTSDQVHATFMCTLGKYQHNGAGYFDQETGRDAERFYNHKIALRDITEKEMIYAMQSIKPSSRTGLSF